MKHLILPATLALTLSCGAALTLSCGAAFAQQPDPAQTPQSQAPYHHHAPDPQKQAEHLGKQLNLTPDQTAKIEPILATRDQQTQALWQNQQLTPQDRHQQMRTINETAEQGMAAVLTPDQMTQLKAMRHAHGHHGPNTGNGDNAQQPS